MLLQKGGVIQGGDGQVGSGHGQRSKGKQGHRAHRGQAGVRTADCAVFAAPYGALAGRSRGGAQAWGTFCGRSAEGVIGGGAM
ncbi:hypothetical protein CT3_39150 [Comamonas terrigena NBRC 13299]|nr:hypothetical protein CT3_39150 [Comamonas terrigena NBRC 13299]